MQDHTLLSDIAQQAGAGDQDIEELLPDWETEVVQDSNGINWVPDTWRRRVFSDLTAQADYRQRNERITKADAALTASYTKLQNMHRPAPMLQPTVSHQKRMLTSVQDALDCLVELVDAKAANHKMSRTEADAIHAEATLLRQDAENNAERALAAIRSLFGSAA